MAPVAGSSHSWQPERVACSSVAFLICAVTGMACRLDAPANDVIEQRGWYLCSPQPSSAGVENRSNTISKMPGASTTGSFGAAGSNRVPLVIAFAVLQVLGGIGMLSVLFTMLFSRQVHRQTTWVNFCLSWIIYAFSYILLVLFNGEFGKEPNRALCATQAALIYGAPVVFVLDTAGAEFIYLRCMR
ncbi:hypothetical protein GLOTRDRAFT_92096 [Gloeophyllum trabeum ATCC 11539]|uniref:Uncharacterized protein n=1 Tax=Gloeophyllum trabeum (strain ATCC 11539 / FP-39264 / Madison 617) TaxID=670483 RepID=S7QC20_GLOTA|nr:uncharacterized protein GLOTRDRAFT_92096 [Gloeophyllum trabeum ATCC 11539]EPQ56892.1 hypothetical protein GLOTRDRAFT_92096 [Gloeophyllum trabeum ATCC 11539]